MNLADEIKSHVKELQFAVFLTLFRWICPSSIVFSEYKILGQISVKINHYGSGTGIQTNE